MSFKQFIYILITLVVILAIISFVTTIAQGAEYDSSIDYMDLMIQAAIKGDEAALEEAARLRDQKILGENLAYKSVSPDELIESFESRVGFSLHTDYMSLMEQAIRNGDAAAGRSAAQKRNIKISYLGMEYMKCSYDDLRLLAAVINTEVGSSWLPIEWKMAVGEVVLNRVAHRAFPGSIYDVVYQAGQYAGKSNYSYTPSNASIEAAVRLMNGERIFYDTSVVFQANFCQGHGVARSFYDSYFGYTYFCYY